MFTSRRFQLALLSLLATIVAAAATAPGASAAAQRYASPGGTGSACSSAIPCSIADAVGGASSGDEVIVNPGDYALTATLITPYNITVHGVAGQPRPRLLFSGVGQEGMRVIDSTLRYVEVDQMPGRDSSALFASDAVVEQVIARASENGYTAQLSNSTALNSMFVASGPNALALDEETSGGTNTSTFRNVTAIASGSGGVAMYVRAGFAAGKTSIQATNLIARGGPGGYGVKVRTDSTGAHATLTLAHSNYGAEAAVGTNAVITDGGGNQSGAPAFVNAAGGDYRVAPGSPTIDAGLDDPLNGALDLDGVARKLGTTDIGANELLGPAPAPGPDPVPPTTPAPPADPPAQSFAGVRLVSTGLTLRGRFVTVRLSCPAGTTGGCTGRTKLTARRRTLGRVGFSIAAGKRATVRVRVSRAGRRLFAHRRRLSGKAANAAHSGAGQSKTTVAAVTIRRRG